MTTKELAQKIMDLANTSADLVDFSNKAYYLCDSIVRQNESAPKKAVIEGWVCRDADGSLNLFTNNDKPEVINGDNYWSIGYGDVSELPEESFPSVTWDNSPRKVRIEITLLDGKEEEE